MSFRNKLKYFLVHHAGIQNKEAQSLIQSGAVLVNGQITVKNIAVTEYDKIVVNDRVIQQPVQHKYFLFYKPKGIETTHSRSVKESLINHFPQFKNLFFAGRLDKESEGLLLLTTDGKLVNDLAHPFFQKEKEYIVKVDSEIDDVFKFKMEQGIVIRGIKTAPCKVGLISKTSFSIVLTEGKNRQIRRMCYKLGYEVLFLKRVRIAGWGIGDMQPGETKEILL